MLSKGGLHKSYVSVTLAYPWHIACEYAFMKVDDVFCFLIPAAKRMGIDRIPYARASVRPSVRHSVRNTFVSAPYLLNPLNEFH